MKLIRLSTITLILFFCCHSVSFAEQKNLALGCAVSVGRSTGGENIVDGNYSTVWSSSSSATTLEESWIKLNFNKKIIFDRIIFTASNRSASVTSFKIEISDTGPNPNPPALGPLGDTINAAAWTTVHTSHAGFGAQNTKLEIKLDEEVSAQYMRVTALTKVSGMFGMAEIEVYHDIPSAESVFVTGLAQVGQTLTGAYTYKMNNTLPEGTSLLQWHIKAAAEEKFSPIKGAHGSAYTIKEEDADMYIAFSVTPINSAGIEGIEVFAEDIITPTFNNLLYGAVTSENNAVDGRYNTSWEGSSISFDMGEVKSFNILSVRGARLPAETLALTVRCGDGISDVVSTGNGINGDFRILLSQTYIESRYISLETEGGIEISVAEIELYMEDPYQSMAENDARTTKIYGIDSMKSRIALPDISENNCNITWESSDNNLLKIAKQDTKTLAIPVRPLNAEGNKTVSLIATFELNGKTANAVYEVTILSYLPDAEAVAMDISLINLGDLSHVTSDISLPSEGLEGSVITWESGNPDVISSSGEVSRPKDGKNKTVSLLATVQRLGASDTAAFAATVISLPYNPPSSAPGKARTSSGGFPAVKAEDEQLLPIPPADEAPQQGSKLPVDVSQAHWGYRYVEALARKGVISGDQDNAFNPEHPITREQFLKMLILAGGFKTEQCSLEFEDVDSGAWYYPYVETAYSLGIINGLTPVLFGINEQIKREDMAVMSLRALGIFAEKPLQNSTPVLFNDQSDISDYAVDAVGFLQNAGIILGDENGYFNPSLTTSKIEAAKVVYLLFDMEGQND